jgi:hypothetical protein
MYEIVKNKLEQKNLKIKIVIDQFNAIVKIME